MEDWKRVVFTDESTLCSRWDYTRRVWRPDRCRYDPENAQQVDASGRTSVGLWGAVTHQGLAPLIRIDGRFNGVAYKDLLLDNFLTYALDSVFYDGAFVLQHDRSPVHRARVVTESLDDACIQTLSWPPKVYDLNITENVWGLVKGRFSERNLRNQSAESLWEAANEEWEHLRLDTTP